MEKTSKTSTPPLPINLITGLLGSGKTTAIKSLIEQKPPQENWGILINEFGDIGIDAASLPPQESLSILEVSGGCICCTAALGLTQSLNQLLSHPIPFDRILIEPTGLGHPAKIIDTLTQGGFAQPIELAQILCIITPQQLTPERWQKSAVMRDLVTLSDIVFLNKTDTSTPQQLTQAQQVLAQCYPSKQQIKPTQFARINLNDLQATHTVQFPLFLSGQDQHQQETTCQTQAYTSLLPEVTQCQIQLGEQTSSIGWIFSTNLQLNRSKFIKITQAWANLIRIKGLLRTGKEWQLINGVEGELQFEDIAWRKDNRLELIFDSNKTLDKFKIIEQTLTSAFIIKGD